MQTAYSNLAPEALLGLMTEDFTRYVDSVIPQTAVKVAKLLTADKTSGLVRNAAKLPAAAADITKPGAMGIVPWDQSREGGSDWPTKRPTPVLRRGRIWVMAESAIARWTHPFVRHAAGAGTELGSFRGDADVVALADTATVCPFILALTDAEAGSLVLVEISLF
jgi:hypothetical protein